MNNNNLGCFATTCLVVSICVIALWFWRSNVEREKFETYNRATVPDEELEQIEGPMQVAITFDKYFHINKIKLRNDKGQTVLEIPTNFPNVKGWDYSDPLFFRKMRRGFSI